MQFPIAVPASGETRELARSGWCVRGEDSTRLRRNGAKLSSVSDRAVPITTGELVAFVGSVGVATVMPRLVPHAARSFYLADDTPALLMLAVASMALYGLSLLAVTRGDVRRVLPGALVASAICTVAMSLGIVCLRPSEQLVSIAASALVLTIPAIKTRCRLSIIEALAATVPVMVALTFAGILASGVQAAH